MKVVKTIALSSGLTVAIVEGSPAPGNQVEEINTTTLADVGVTKAPRAQVEKTDLEFTAECSGTALVAGTEGTLTIAVTDNAGASTSNSVPGFIKSAVPVTVAVDGERRMLQRIVWTPSGATATTTTTGA